MKSNKPDIRRQGNQDAGQGRERARLRWGLLIPNSIVFASSLCIMVLELTAGRLIARYVGFSLYTWTSVIGVVLAGIAVGNFLGGRLADRFQPRRMLATLFLLAAVSCVAVPILNQAVGGRLHVVAFDWPVKVFVHVLALFFVPSLLLGMISPVVAKWALEQGLRTGRTLGDVYAWGAAGSIVGTFLTGFLLIPALGTLVIMGCVTVVLAALGVLFLIRGRTSAGLAAGFILLLTGSLQAYGWTLGIPRSPDTRALYERESQYAYINVLPHPNDPEMRVLRLDALVHSVVNMREPTDISTPHQDDYIKLSAALTRLAAGQKTRLRTLFLGGGGYVMPRYIERFWPGSHIEVAEIDPAVTDAATQALGLSRTHPMRITHLDARNHVDDLLRQQQQGQAVGGFDVIYGDVFNYLAVPFQLTTLEFNEKLRALLAPDGIYILNLVDAPVPGRFLGAQRNTLRRIFPYVTVFSVLKPTIERGMPGTFIVVGALRPLRFDQLELARGYYRQLDDVELKGLEARTNGLVLRDDYVPVEHLLSPVIRARKRATEGLAAGSKLMQEGHQFVQQGRYDDAIAQYREAMRLAPNLAGGLHYNIAELLASRGKLDEAVVEYREAIRLRPDDAEFHVAIASVLSRQKKFEEAERHRDEARRIDPNALRGRAGRLRPLHQLTPPRGRN